MRCCGIVFSVSLWKLYLVENPKRLLFCGDETTTGEQEVGVEVPAPLISHIASLAAYNERAFSRAIWSSDPKLLAFPPMDWQDVTSLVAAIRWQDGEDFIDSSNWSASINIASWLWVLVFKNETRSMSWDTLCGESSGNPLAGRCLTVDDATYHLRRHLHGWCRRIS